MASPLYHSIRGKSSKTYVYIHVVFIIDSLFYGKQVLGQEIQNIASKYHGHQNASAYKHAAQVFRIPYWDWAASARLPPSCAQQNITVNGPHGPLTLRNPLYSYRWQTYPLNQSQFPGSGDWPAETTRASNGKEDFSLGAVNANLTKVADELRDLVVSKHYVVTYT